MIVFLKRLNTPQKAERRTPHAPPRGNPLRHRKRKHKAAPDWARLGLRLLQCLKKLAGFSGALSSGQRYANSNLKKNKTAPKPENGRRSRSNNDSLLPVHGPRRQDFPRPFHQNLFTAGLAYAEQEMLHRRRLLAEGVASPYVRCGGLLPGHPLACRCGPITGRATPSRGLQSGPVARICSHLISTLFGEACGGQFERCTSGCAGGCVRASCQRWISERPSAKLRPPAPL